MKFSHLIVFAIAATGGWFAARNFPPARQTNDAEVSQKITCSQCPMLPWVKSDKPGDCTICGMDLVAVHAGGKNMDHSVDGIVMLPPGSPNILGVQVREVKRQQIREANENWASLEKSKELAQSKKEFYESREFMNTWEITALSLGGLSAGAQTAIAVGYALASELLC